MLPTLNKVLLNRDVLWAITAHALSNEHQEIMGLCLGRIDDNIAYVERSLMIARKHKQKDRVEVSVEDLGQASEIAEQLSMRIIAWYHSHPHITCPPSHVDVKTQGSFQMLDTGFFGLIVSCFDQNQGQIDICAFQSHMVYTDDCPSGFWIKKEVPITVVCNETRLLDSLVALQLVFLNEEKEVYDKYTDKKSRKLHVKSDLELSKSSSIYESTLIKLIDNQIIPLEMSLDSKIASLKLEKEELEKKIKMVNNNDQLPQTYTKVSDAHSSSVLESLVRTIPNWHQHCRILQDCMNGIDCIVIDQMNLNIKTIECVITVEPSTITLKHSRCLPWVLSIKQNELLISKNIISIEDIDVAYGYHNNALKIMLLHDNDNEMCVLVVNVIDRNINAKNLNSALKLDKLH